MGGCAENVRSSSKMCGSRQPTFASGLQYAQSLPGEFPWTCLILNQNNDFVGSCAVIPNDFSNDNGRPTRKILTAAHKLKDVGRNDLLKVRVGEWDASGFNSPEQVNHQEYTVVRILKHPQFRWTVVGLVTWGVGCASETPGVYVRISHFRDWINAN